MSIEESTQQMETLIEAWQLDEADLNQTDINAMQVLLKENQELKLELSGYRHAILNNKEMLGLKEQNKRLKQKYENAVADYETTMFEKEQLNSLVNSCQEEIRQLKKQVEEQIATNEVLSHELTKDKILKQDHLTTCCGMPIKNVQKLINQQKEFINYLEEKIKYFKDLEQFAIKIFNNKAVINLDLIKRNIEEDNLLICNFEEILQKYKEIIGDDK